MDTQYTEKHHRRRLTSADFTHDPDANHIMLDGDATTQASSPKRSFSPSRRKCKIALIVGLCVLVTVILGVASFVAWYFTREGNNKVLHVVGQITLDIHSLQATLYSMEKKQQEVSLGQVSGGKLKFQRYCTLDVARSASKDLQQQYLCLLFSSAKAATPDYRLLIQPADTQQSGDFSCQEVRWDYPKSHALKDCFSLNNTHIYGGGQRRNQRWPSNLQPINVPDVTTFPSSSELYANVVVPYWLFTSGLSIMADQRYGVAVEIDSPSSENRFCIGRHAEPFILSSLPDTDTKTTVYTICSGRNLTDIHLRSLDKYRSRKPEPSFDFEMIQRPLWSTMSYGVDEEHNLDQDAVIALADMIALQELPVSRIVIDPRWEDKYLGDGFNAEFFPQPKKLLSELQLRNVTAIFTFHPFLSFSNKEYLALSKDPTTRKYFAKEGGRLGSPLTADWWMGRAAMLDFTEPDAVRWKAEKVQTFFRDYDADTCRFLGGSAGWIPEPDDGRTGAYWRNFHLKYSDGARRVCGENVLVETSGVFDGSVVRMMDARARTLEPVDRTLSDGLRSLIPSVLTISLLGHPLFIAPSVGGNPFINQSGQIDLETAELRYPSAKMFLRWLGVVLFMPVIEFTVPPWVFPETEQQDIVEAARNLLSLRQNHTEYIVRSAKECLKSSLPLIRPMWWKHPTDHVTWTIDDQYFVGNKLLVAPIVSSESDSRKIYLPDGKWAGSDGEIEKGPRWLSVTVSLQEIPIFWEVMP
ncbi:hypothetical protein RvY_12187 [Ramazzottius varieornatus]|uniref:Glycoside hydrolase family 31 N-terminal domain-containing protein n=1 Tax=Ramazzottius varieornatus TaxID=947166 RepID=A0A1D1VKN1_RAMVA|nr:hypothetical protein RvY_12187 [Ramazzottius varieornatus]